MFLEWYIPVPDTQGAFTVKSSIVGKCNIKSLKKSFKICLMKDSPGSLSRIKRIKKFDLNQKLKKIKISPVKFDLEKQYDEYVVVLNFPFKLKILTDFGGGFCKFLGFIIVFKKVLCLHQEQSILYI